MHRLLVGRQSQAVGQSLDVGIDDDARGDSKRGAKHHIGRFAADAGQGGQCFQVAGDLPIVLLCQSCSAIALMFLALARKKPVDRISSWSSAGSAAAMPRASGNL